MPKGRLHDWEGTTAMMQQLPLGVACDARIGLNLKFWLMSKGMSDLYVRSVSPSHTPDILHSELPLTLRSSQLSRGLGRL